MVLALSLYAVFIAYPFVLGRRARGSRDPYLTAIAGQRAVLLRRARRAAAGRLRPIVGVVPVVEGAVMALLLRELLRIEPTGARDLGTARAGRRRGARRS